MPDWTGSFKPIYHTTEEFKKMKAEYVAKYGYTITVPGLSDIIHIGTDVTMTAEETQLWKARKYDEIPEKRREKIKEMKADRKKKFLSMLGSPTPLIVQNSGTLMTAIDNAQDALGTLAYTGKVALALAPRAIAKSLLGPVGWTMTAAETLNLVQKLGYQKLGPKKAKRQKDAATQDNPKSKMYKIKGTNKWVTILPSQGRIVEALQVSDNVFGIGICLGPLVGFAIESVAGPVRRIMGAKVGVDIKWPFLSHFTMKAQRQARSQLAYIGAGLQTETDEVMMMTMANYLGQQELLSHASQWKADDEIADLENVEIAAPRPTNILTQEVIEEEGINIDDVCGWPHSGGKWLRMGDIGAEYDTACKGFQADFMELHNNDWYGYAYGGLTTQGTGYSFASVVGENNVSYDYTSGSKWAHIMLDNGFVVKKGQSASKMGKLIAEIERLEVKREGPTMRNIQAFCTKHGIGLESFL